MRFLPVAILLAAASFCSQADAQMFREPCHADSLCPGVQPGGGKIVACLKTHKSELSEQCYAALGRFMLNRQQGNGQRNGNGGGQSRAMGPGGGQPQGDGPDPSLQ